MRTWTLTAFVASGLLGVAMGTASTAPHVNRTMRLGSSVEGRAIMAVELGDPRGPKVVVGCIHGNETAGIVVVERLLRLRTPKQ